MGFHATWTEIKDPDSGAGCSEFRCRESKFCIAPALRCDANPNCGQFDDTDEANCKFPVKPAAADRKSPNSFEKFVDACFRTLYSSIFTFWDLV